MQRDQALGPGTLVLTLGFLMSGCEAETGGLNELSLPTDAGPLPDASSQPDTGPRPDSGTVAFDSGVVPADCTTPNPAGCVVNACPPNAVCDPNLGCAPSACVCSDGAWDCTADCGGGMCRPTELTFRLIWNSDVLGDVAYAQSGGGQTWINVYDAAGQDVVMDADCGLCPCDNCFSCALCGFAPVVSTPFGGPLGPMERIWDGTTHRQGRCGTSPGSNVACQDYQPLQPGRYTARFCFGYRTVQNRSGEFVDNPQCHDVEFDWPTANPVIVYEQCDCG